MIEWSLRKLQDLALLVPLRLYVKRVMSSQKSHNSMYCTSNVNIKKWKLPQLHPSKLREKHMTIFGIKRQAFVNAWLWTIHYVQYQMTHLFRRSVIRGTFFNMNWIFEQWWFLSSLVLVGLTSSNSMKSLVYLVVVDRNISSVATYIGWMMW